MLDKLAAYESALSITFLAAPIVRNWDSPENGPLLFQEYSLWKFGLCSNLRRAVHAYMSCAEESHAVHFGWDDQKQRPDLTPLGKRLIACIDLYTMQLNDSDSAPVDKSWNTHIYEESSKVRIFRRTLGCTASKILAGRLYLGRSKLKPIDMQMLQHSLEKAVEICSRPKFVAWNRSFEKEMSYTRNSVATLLKELRALDRPLLAIPLALTLPTVATALKDSKIGATKKGQDTSSFPECYLDHLQTVAGFVQWLGREFNHLKVSHLVSLSGTTAHNPECRLLFFVADTQEASAESFRRTIYLAWNDYFIGHSGTNRWVLSTGAIHQPKADILKFSGGKSDSWQKLERLIDLMLFSNLNCERLKLPKGRRSWSKGKVSIPEQRQR